MKPAIRGLVISTAFTALPIAALAETTYSHTNVPVAVICPNPRTTAYLESPEAPPHFSQRWEYIGGHSHCRTVKNDRPLIVVKVGYVTFRGREYQMVEMFPGGLVVSTDGFGGPYFLLASRLKSRPNAEQMLGNAKSFLPTAIDYSKIPPQGAMP